MKYKTKQFKDGEVFSSSNAVLEIENGDYLRGQLDKGTLGDGSKGLIHRICNDYGNMASADFIDDPTKYRYRIHENFCIQCWY